eukprot:CAMPEP_0197247802 /NCGR_PEP_ID=MMETSP1429-20130617/32480_1 /TAXON_ID=49237 /ORGANISM="Chaetoceros  sp., Strain UNC1202" /LENGTH=215 /DNA_ID=CAMNT_0042708819 /DNA_START=72 /DNA_END=719 /DNA_ORIENTATION=+
MELITKAIILLSFLGTAASKVINLTDDNFEHLTQASTGQTTGKWFVNFSSPKCPHCQNLGPKWSTLAEELGEDHPDSSVVIATVNVLDNPRVADRFDIKSLPTIKLFAEQGVYEYDPQASREVDPLAEYALGGYKTGKKEEVPKKTFLLGLIEDLRWKVNANKPLRDLLNDAEDILMFRKNAAFLLMFVGFIFGILFMQALDLIGGNSTKKVKKD